MKSIQEIIQARKDKKNHSKEYSKMGMDISRSIEKRPVHVDNQIHIPPIRVPEAHVTVEIPPIELPDIIIPEIKLPEINVPEATIKVELPEIKVPTPEVTVNVPEIKIPEIKVPEAHVTVEMPEMEKCPRIIEEIPEYKDNRLVSLTELYEDGSTKTAKFLVTGKIKYSYADR